MLERAGASLEWHTTDDHRDVVEVGYDDGLAADPPDRLEGGQSISTWCEIDQELNEELE